MAVYTPFHFLSNEGFISVMKAFKVLETCVLIKKKIKEYEAKHFLKIGQKSKFVRENLKTITRKKNEAKNV